MKLQKEAEKEEEEDVKWNNTFYGVIVSHDILVKRSNKQRDVGRARCGCIVGKRWAVKLGEGGIDFISGERAWKGGGAPLRGYWLM